MTEKQVISMREIQRNYKKIFNKARRSQEPIVLGVRGNPQVVVMGMEAFSRLQRDGAEEQRDKKWEEIFRTLARIAQEGRRGVDLGAFVQRDRQAH